MADPAGRLISSLYLSNPTTQASDSRYFQYDGLGNVISRTNQQGNAVTSYSYEAFGAITSQSGQESNSYTYMGQAYDASTGLYYFNARWYDASIGRFISADPLPGNPFQSGSTNRYAYALNNPIAYEDTSGLAPMKSLRAATQAFPSGGNKDIGWSFYTDASGKDMAATWYFGQYKYVPVLPGTQTNEDLNNFRSFADKYATAIDQSNTAQENRDWAIWAGIAGLIVALLGLIAAIPTKGLSLIAAVAGVIYALFAFRDAFAEDANMATAQKAANDANQSAFLYWSRL